jgi:hypothetical protein
VNSGLSVPVGNSKSRSIPSKFLDRTKFIAELMNVWRLAAVDNMIDIAHVPAVAPPTDSKVFRFGFIVFSLLMRWYLIVINNTDHHLSTFQLRLI